MTPETLLYAKTHEWVAVETAANGEKTATVGLSEFALHALTDLVYLNLPEVGQQVTAEQPFGEVESVKAVSDLYSPVDGEVIAAHKELAQSLETLGRDPYGEGWLVKIRIGNPAALANLMDYAAYQKQCEQESGE
jgi:glycine cleavage system H protein